MTDPELTPLSRNPKEKIAPPPPTPSRIIYRHAIAILWHVGSMTAPQAQGYRALVMKIKHTYLALALTVAGLLPGTAAAALIVNIEEQGSDVVASYSGSIDTTGIGFNFVGASNLKRVYPSGGVIQFNDAANYASVVGFGKNPWTVAPTAFGTGDIRIADSFSIAAGNAFGFQPDAFYLNSGYVSGTTISGSMTFENETLASMGINEGTGIMNATFSSGDTLTVNAISAVPEPSSSLLGLTGLILGSAFRRRRKLA